MCGSREEETEHERTLLSPSARLLDEGHELRSGHLAAISRRLCDRRAEQVRLWVDGSHARMQCMARGMASPTRVSIS